MVFGFQDGVSQWAGQTVGGASAYLLSAPVHCISDVVAQACGMHFTHTSSHRVLGSKA